ncbi:hypothetical protein predicted by Glimmer/Critica [Acetobacter ghanensis]|uniref:Uncharacterized protein n=1 Tax=Acetobacter ghanensis TaxID=431306 RepID=A0A0U5FWR2_9PROT|nr:hypothetical protein predicted by Glimmer/Critica [Acetobacter ghanensis]
MEGIGQKSPVLWRYGRCYHILVMGQGPVPHCCGVGERGVCSY